MHAKMRYLNASKEANKRRRLAEANFSRDREEDILNEIEDQLEEEVRYLWKRTRDMAGHEGWVDVVDVETGELYCTGCDCNIWNRVALKEAIQRLRLWRRGIYQAY